MLQARIQDILDTRGWLLADGATGTNLFAAGLEAGEPPEFWNEHHPDRVRSLCAAFISAGAELILTNSFGSNRLRLKLHAAGHRAFHLSRMAAEIARSAADPSAAIVAGSVGPTGELMEPIGQLGHADAVEVFQEQMEGLREGGADVLWVETMSSLEEFSAAAEACCRVGLPWMGCMSFDTTGRTMMGVRASDLVAATRSFDYPPIALGANCGAGASDLVLTILGFSACSPDWPLIAKGNAGIPRFEHDSIVYDGTPELMADYAVLALASGARIIGGCCGTTAVHIAHMKEALERARERSKPDRHEIERRLGKSSLPLATVARRRRRRGRPAR